MNVDIVRGPLIKGNRHPIKLLLKVCYYQPLLSERVLQIYIVVAFLILHMLLENIQPDNWLCLVLQRTSLSYDPVGWMATQLVFEEIEKSETSLIFVFAHSVEAVKSILERVKGTKNAHKVSELWH